MRAWFSEQRCGAGLQGYSVERADCADIPSLSWLWSSSLRRWLLLLFLLPLLLILLLLIFLPLLLLLFLLWLPL